MNAKQSRFVEEYLKDQNATQAAIRAGYSKANAESIGSRLSRNVEVAAAISQGLVKVAVEVRKSTKLTKARVVRELKALALSNVSHYRVSAEGYLEAAPDAPDNAMAAVSSVDRRVYPDGSVEVKFRLWDKPGTLKLAGRHVDVKGFSDRMELTGKGGGPIQVMPMTAEEAAREIAAIEAEARGEKPAIDVEPIEPGKEPA